MDEGRHAENSPFYRSRSAVALTITVSRKNRINSETTLLEERFMAVYCTAVPPLPTQTSKHSNMVGCSTKGWNHGLMPVQSKTSGSQVSIRCTWQKEHTSKNNECDIKKREGDSLLCLFSWLWILPVNFSVFWLCLFKPLSTASSVWQWEVEAQSLMRSFRVLRPSMVTDGRSHSGNPRDPPGLAVYG